MKALVGAVLIAQEGRIHILDEEGAGRLFLLSPKSPVETSQLHALQAAQARVRIRYAEAPHLIALVAHDIEILDGDAA